jgi:hypothetical protein
VKTKSKHRKTNAPLSPLDLCAEIWQTDIVPNERNTVEETDEVEMLNNAIKALQETRALVIQQKAENEARLSELTRLIQRLLDKK